MMPEREWVVGFLMDSDAEQVILIRKNRPEWQAGKLNGVGGKVEPGELIGGAMYREFREETGVIVQDIRYPSSQPWPFPASLMVGFQARCSPDAVIQIGGELEDVRWFTRAEIKAGAAGLPPSHSISYRLISTWLADAAGAAGAGDPADV